ncbi:MAG: hypothetical protein AB7S50_03590 [Bacteroidales bacterium]
MRRLKIIFDFIRFSIADKVAFCRTVVTNMTDNPSFPSPDVSLLTVIEAVNKLEASMIAAMDGGKVAKVLMHEAEADVIEIFRKLASYVERVANGDEAIMLSSGFNLSKERVSIKRLELNVTQNDFPGTVSLKRRAVEGAMSYLWQYCQNDSPVTEDGWIFAGASAQTKFQITNLSTTGKYWFRSAAVTREGTTAYCTPVFKVVQ